MAQTIKFKRGQSANLGSLALQPGEPAITLDTGKMYVGDNAGGKILINPTYAAPDHNHDARYSQAGHNHPENALLDHDHQISDIVGLGSAANKNAGSLPGCLPILDADGKLPDTTIPKIAIGEPFPVASESEMLALDAQVGDVAVRSDVHKNYILKTAPASTLTNWVAFETAADAVSSVNGKTGTVILTASDVGAEPAISTKNSAFNKNYETNTANILSDGTVSVGTSDTIARGNHRHPTDTTRAPINSPNFTGTPTAPTPAAGDSGTSIATTLFVGTAITNALSSLLVDGGTF